MTKKIWKPYIVAGLTLLLGFSASIMLYRFNKKTETVRMELLFNNDCEATRTSINRELERSIDLLSSVKSNFVSHKGMTREQYRTAITYSLKNIETIDVMGWIPIVPFAQRESFEKKARQEGFPDFQFTEIRDGKRVVAVKRDSYFPLYYVEPYENNKLALGYDLASNKERKAALEKAASTGEATATESIVLVQHLLEKNNKSFVVVLPVYEDELGISKTHKVNFFLSAGINTSTLIEEALSNINISNNIALTVVDLNKKNKEVLYTNSPNHDVYRFSKNSTLQVANRSWQLQFRSPPFDAFGSTVPTTMLTILVMFITVLISIFAFRILTDNRKELRLVNMDLLNEISVRKYAEETLKTESAYIKLLQKVATASNESKTIEVAAQITIDKICELTGWPLGHLYLVDNSKDVKLHTTDIWHIDNPDLFKVFREITEVTDFDMGIGLPGRVWESKIPIWISDVSNDINFPRNKVAESIKIKTGFAFPILVEENVVGILEFYSLEIIREPNMQLLEVATNIGVLLGRVIERNKAAEKLRKEQVSLAGAQKIAHIGNWEWDVLLNKIEWSDELYKIYGLIPQEFEANYENFLKFTHPDDREYVDKIIKNAFKDQKPFNFFHKIVQHDGTVRVLSSIGSVFTDSNGNTIRMSGTAQDITETKKSEMELRDSQNQIKTIFENAPDAVVMIDEEGKITRWNPMAESIFGWTESEVAGKELGEVIIPERFIKGHQEGMKHFIETKEGPILYKLLELKAVGKDKLEFDIGLSISPTFLNGKYFFIGFLRNITEQKKAAIALKDNAIRLEASSNILEIRNTQLVDFCSIVSHNLRAPLVNIAMLTDYIDQCDEYEERKEMIVKMKSVVSHLNEVFNELVESVQVRRDTEIDLDKINLKECLNNTLKVFESQIETYKADIQINFDEASVIYFPQKYIDSIISNLISNALKYKSPERTPIIKIKTEKVGENILLSMKDNGLGIDLKRHKDNIFKIRKVFHKHPEARGFGLFLIRTQVEAMDGKIWVESTPDVGSTFFIEFKKQNI